jgi:hypothetical protein
MKAKGVSGTARTTSSADAARHRQARKDLARVESQLAKLATRMEILHTALAEGSADYAKLVSLGAELEEAVARQGELEGEWLELAERLGE